MNSTAKLSTDRDLERRIVNFLAAKHVPGLRQLEVRASAGTVILSGRVRTYYEKQLCNQCCQRVAGVHRLVNAVDVESGCVPSETMPGAAAVV